MTKKIVVLLLAVFIYMSPIAFANPSVSSGSAILMEAETGQILFQKNSNQKQYPASITKVLTAIVAIEHNNNLNEIINIGNDVPNQIENGSSAIYLLPGEKLTMEQLFYGLLVESANDAAVAIAEHTSGSVDKFAVLMNEKAKELGATNSNFVNPNGLHNDEHYSTAHDMALIMREAIKNPVLRKFMTTNTYIIPETNKQQTRYLWTKNKLFKSKSSQFFYEKVIASKTGYTTKAKNTLVSAADDNGMELVTVVLQSNGAVAYTDTISMFEYGFKNFKELTLINKNELIKEYQVKDASSPLKIVSRSTVKYIVNKGEEKEIKSNILLQKDIPSSIKQGQKIGTVQYLVDNHKFAEADLVAGNEVISKSTLQRNRLLKSLLWLIPGLIILYLVARIYVLSKNMKIRKRKNSRRPTITFNSVTHRRSRRSRRNEYSKY